MKRARFLAAMADSSSELLMQTFWATLPETLRNHYMYISLVWTSPLEVVEYLQKLTPSELMDTMVLMESPSGSLLPWDFEQVGREGRGIAISLVLSFPEIYFVFLGKIPPAADSRRVFEKQRRSIEAVHFVSWSSILWLTELIRHHVLSFRTLFDPSGLRNLLKHRLLDVQGKERRGLLYLERIQRRLDHDAAVADEEEDYAYLHAYCLYRMGYAARLLGTEQEFRYQLQPGDRRCAYLGPPRVVITDWDLAYPDHEGDLEDAAAPSREVHDQVLSPLQEMLDEMNQPMLVVTGYPKAPTLVVFKANADAGRGSRKSIGKPHGGIFKIMSEVAEICGPGETIAASAHPPQSHENSDYFRHSLPFGRGVIVDSLMQRAEGLKHDEPSNVRESVLQSVLALEAKELLGEISRTKAYEATYLQIDGELSAELSWFGIGFEAEVEDRIDEIESESREMLRNELHRLALNAGSTRHREPAHLTDEQQSNYLYRVFDLMRDKYNRNGQIVAGELCHKKVVNWRSKIPNSRESWAGRSISRLAFVATAGGTEVKRILLFTLGIILVWTVINWFLLGALHSPDVGCLKRILLSLGHSIVPFVGLQPGLDDYKEIVKNANPSDLWRVLNFLAGLVEMLMAFLNLGLLLSVVYRKLTRAAV